MSSPSKSKKKKILILSATIGHGHMSPAKAVQQAMDLKYPGKYEVVVIDFIESLGKFFNLSLQKTSYGMWKYAPKLYKKLFWGTNSEKSTIRFNKLHSPLVSKKIKKLLEKERADLLLSVYPVWHYTITKINSKHKYSPLFVSLITDSISVHRAWVTGEIDYHLVASSYYNEPKPRESVSEDSVVVLAQAKIDAAFDDLISVQTRD